MRVCVVTQNCRIFNSECESYTICVGDAVSFIQFMDTVATEIPSKWKRICVAVGMSQSHIDEVDNYCRGKSFDCFCDAFKHWQDASTPEQPANWASLVTVLHSRIVGEALAKRIQKTFM